MKKLLILAYDFPPYVSVGGLRPYSWYKYLHEFGVYPVVVTRQWDNKYKNSLDYIAPGSSPDTIIETTDWGTIIKTPYAPNLANRLYLKYGNSKYNLVRKIISAYYELAQYVVKIGPKAGLYRGAKNYLKNNKVDAIIATADPYILLKYAADLGKEFNVPAIADYRDPWSQDTGFHKNPILKNWYIYFEKKTLKNIQIVTTVSSFFQNQIAQLATKQDFYIMPNGYDEEVINKAKTVKQESEVLSFAFVGTIYAWHPIKNFLRVVKEFVIQNPDAKLCLNFYGLSLENDLTVMLENEFSTLKPYVKIHGKIKNELFVAELAKNNIMVLFNHYSTIGTKIYEFIGIKRLILLCYSNDPEAEELKKQHFNLAEEGKEFPQLQSELINETKSGIVVENAQHLQAILPVLYTQFKNNGYIECDSVNETQFSRRIQAKKLAEIVKKL
jgi:glycosyltransferase involved in cell wall biosynthesis